MAPACVRNAGLHLVAIDVAENGVRAGPFDLERTDPPYNYRNITFWPSPSGLCHRNAAGPARPFVK